MWLKRLSGYPCSLKLKDTQCTLHVAAKELSPGERQTAARRELLVVGTGGKRCPKKPENSHEGTWGWRSSKETRQEILQGASHGEPQRDPEGAQGDPKAVEQFVHSAQPTGAGTEGPCNSGRGLPRLKGKSERGLVGWSVGRCPEELNGGNDNKEDARIKQCLLCWNTAVPFR